MKWVDRNGKVRNVSIKKYLIDWEKPAPSKEAQVVKDFLKEFCKDHIVLEEFRIPRTRLRVDFVNLTRRFAIEHAGRQHTNYTEYFHGSPMGYLNSLKRDDMKYQELIRNDFKFIETTKQDFPLTLDLFLENGIIII